MPRLCWIQSAIIFTPVGENPKSCPSWTKLKTAGIMMASSSFRSETGAPVRSSASFITRTTFPKERYFQTSRSDLNQFRERNAVLFEDSSNFVNKQLLWNGAIDAANYFSGAKHD